MLRSHARRKKGRQKKGRWKKLKKAESITLRGKPRVRGVKERD
jgi:hypothetical protein